jgi:hypothetical protein
MPITQEDLGRMPYSSPPASAGWYVGLGLIAVAEAIGQVASALRSQQPPVEYRSGDLR